ncbi:MAG: carbon-nitrogen family hydrolase [Ignavibacteriaceae bacterium]|nr:carbon-nitrogen family hydrolase [Ignavibacteriaceae bacterium]
MKISMFQFDPVWEDKQQNMERITGILESAKIDSELLIFPEMTLTGFSMNPKPLAESIEGDSAQFFKNLAIKYGTNVVAGIIESHENNFYNTLLVYSPIGELTGSYRKIHPFSLSGEHLHYTGGNNPVIIELNKISVGLSICYDLRFPELFRQYAKERVELIINIANWPVPRINHYEALLKARAIENLCFVAGVNRCGNDPAGSYNGRSSIYAPLGALVNEIIENESIITSNIDFSEVYSVRNKLSFLDDIKLI